MQARLTPSSVLVFGGTGTVGSEVLRGLAQAGIPTTFTYNKSQERAKVLATEFSQEAIRVDLANPENVRGLFQDLERAGRIPDVFIHCAAISTNLSLDKITEEDWSATQTVNCLSALVACQELASQMTRKKEGHIVLVGALDRTQSFPIPVHFAATQGALSAMTMALAKELGPSGIRVNMVALGVLEGGLADQMSPQLVKDYKTFSALRRTGTPREAAKAILWLALENTYITGKVLPINGGI